MKYGFVRVATAVPQVRVADCTFNVEQIERLTLQAEEQKVEIVCFPELSLTSYTCQDLFMQQLLLDEAENALLRLLDFTRSLDIVLLIGLPISYQGILLNCAAVIQKGKLLGVVPKSFLPNYKEFYEKRWFTSGQAFGDCTLRIGGQTAPMSTRMLFHTSSCTFGIEICEDVWATIPPSSTHALKGAEIIFNLSADNEGIGKHNYLKGLVAQQSARCLAGYVFSGCGYGESTQDLIFAGKAFIYENGTLLAEGERFSLEEQLVISEIDVERLRAERRTNTTFSDSISRCTEVDYTFVDIPTSVNDDDKLTRFIDAHPFVPRGPMLDERCEEILQMQSEGLAKRIAHTHVQTVVVGVSGGLDSTLALLVCVQAFDRLGMNRRGIVGITMQGFGTTDRTYTNATNLMKSLNVTIREIPIKEACQLHFSELGIDENVHDVTYENAQARERTQILMDAANQMNGLVIGTGDLSELALGWATYNGDHMSMYGVNASIPKTLVKHLVSWYARYRSDNSSQATLLDIIDTPISPELIPADEAGNISQKTEDLVGPYELHDFFLYHFLRFGFSPAKLMFLAERAFAGVYPHDVVKHWLTIFCRRFFAQQFKRSCLPDGPKVGSCTLSPRGDWRMPSDATATSWINECNNL